MYRSNMRVTKDLRALKEDFDLIVLDLMLPGIDGFGMPQDPGRRKCPDPDGECEKRMTLTKSGGLGLGADDYMTKTVFSERAGSARQGAYGAV